jgi:simple sugar transport system permease protein
MLVGAFGAAALGSASGSLALGMTAGSGAGALLGLIVGGAAIGLGADVFVAGLAANILAPGIISAISQAAFGTKGVITAPAIRAGATQMLCVVIATAAALALFLVRSVFGLRLRAVGEGPEIAKAAGVPSGPYRLVAHIIAGAAAGLAGAVLAAGIGAFAPGMSTGRGWIALVAVYLGGRKPVGVLLASLLLGLLFALSNLAQGFGTLAPSAELLQALPYIVTAIAFIGWRRAEKRRKEGF